MCEFLLQGTKGKSSQPHQLAQVGLDGTSLPLLDSWDWDWNGSKSFLKKSSMCLTKRGRSNFVNNVVVFIQSENKETNINQK